MLIAMLSLYFSNEPNTFNMLILMQNNGAYARTFQYWVYIALFIVLRSKFRYFRSIHGFRTLMSKRQPLSVLFLAGILLKLGTYGILRISYPMLPLAANYFAYGLAVLGLINILYGAFTAMAQTDLKKLVAYSSISHMGYVLLGMAVFTEAGINGAVLQDVQSWNDHRHALSSCRGHLR